PGVEAERGPVLLAQRLGPGQQLVDAVDGLALGVRAVQLDVAERPLGLFPALLEPGRPLGLSAPRGEGLERRLGLVDRRAGPFELALDPAAAGERPVGHDDGLALA